MSYGVGSIITGAAIDLAGYTGMFLLLAAIQAAGLAFIVNRQAGNRSGELLVPSTTDK